MSNFCVYVCDFQLCNDIYTRQTATATAVSYNLQIKAAQTSKKEQEEDEEYIIVSNTAECICLVKIVVNSIQM